MSLPFYPEYDSVPNALDRIAQSNRNRSSKDRGEWVTIGTIKIDRKTETETFTPAECPWCLAHPHRQACSTRCAKAREIKEERSKQP